MTLEKSGRLRQVLHFAEVVRAAPRMIFYSANTRWWTHDPADLVVRGTGVPLDICGSPLFQTEDVAQFLDTSKIRIHPPYKPYPVTTLMAMHHANCREVPDFVRRATAKDFAEYVRLAVEVGFEWGKWIPEPEDR